MPRILIVEDELPMRTALVDLLRANEYRVTAAVDGVAALERALDEKPDLVLLDIMMPGLDGFTVCREIRRRTTTMPILMITAKGQVDDRVTGLDAGADDYLVKPFSEQLQHAKLLYCQGHSLPASRALLRCEINLCIA